MVDCSEKEEEGCVTRRKGGGNFRDGKKGARIGKFVGGYWEGGWIEARMEILSIFFFYFCVYNFG